MIRAARLLLFLGTVLGPAAAFAPPAVAQDLFPGWTVGPAEDATMAVGRRFDCTGGACPPSGLSCLHAETPADEPMWRKLPTTDLMRRRGMPWKEIEGWLAGKLTTLLKPELAGTDAVDPKTWTIAEPARLVDGDAFVAKRYAAEGASVPTAFWMVDGRLNVLVCAGAPGEEDAAWGRIEGLVGGMG